MLNAAAPALIRVEPTEGATGACVVQRFATPRRAVSSSIVGGGIGPVSWVLNITVDSDYCRMDPDAHLEEVAARLGLSGRGIALMTAVGTINLVAEVPARLTDAALVNAVATITEAKVQALLDHGVAGTGTASDAVCVVCRPEGPADPFGGPRSTWGGRLAVAAYDAIAAGIVRQRG